VNFIYWSLFIPSYHAIVFNNSAKYPLACVSKILDVFGPDIGGGFDVGC